MTRGSNRLMAGFLASMVTWCAVPLFAGNVGIMWYNLDGALYDSSGNSIVGKGHGLFLWLVVFGARSAGG